MSRFNDMLNSTLPSKTSRARSFMSMYEEADDFSDFGTSERDMEKYMETEGCEKSCRERCGDEACIGGSCRERCGDEGCSGGSCDESDDYEYDDDYDVDDIDTDNDIEFDDDDDEDDSDDQIEDLGPDEEQKVADSLDVVATPLLLAQEFSVDELEDFTESTDCDIAMEEGYITEKTIVKLDKKAKLAKAYEVALFKIARQHNDKDYIRLEMVWRMERELKARLRAKYHIPAMKEAKAYLQRLKNSKSGLLSKLGHKIGK